MEKEITVAEKVDAIMGAFLSGGMSAETMAFAIDKLYEAARMQKNDSQQSVEEPVVSESTPPELTVLEQMGQQFQSSAQAQIQNNKSFMRPQQQFQSQPAPQTSQTTAPAQQQSVQNDLYSSAVASHFIPANAFQAQVIPPQPIVQPQQPAPQTQQTVAPSQPQPVFQTQSPDPLDPQRIAEARTFGPHAGEPIQPQQPAPQIQQTGAPAQPQQPAPQTQQTGAPTQPQQPAPQTQQPGAPAQQQGDPAQQNADALNGLTPEAIRAVALSQMTPAELSIEYQESIDKVSALKYRYDSQRVIRILLYSVISIIGTVALAIIDKQELSPGILFALSTAFILSVKTRQFKDKKTADGKRKKWNLGKVIQDMINDEKDKKLLEDELSDKEQIKSEIRGRSHSTSE